MKNIEQKNDCPISSIKLNELNQNELITYNGGDNVTQSVFYGAGVVVGAIRDIGNILSSGLGTWRASGGVR